MLCSVVKYHRPNTVVYVRVRNYLTARSLVNTPAYSADDDGELCVTVLH